MVLEEIMNNKALWVAALAWFIAQAAKIILTLIEDRKMDWSRVYGTGGMPSSHSALVSALAVSLGKNFGFHSPFFAMSAVFGLVVMYDAAGIRRAAGKQAEAINTLLTHSGLTPGEQLKVLLGHTPFQVVVGAFVGIGTGFII